MEAWGWLPPPLVHEGKKVQPEWLFRFLLDPTPIRPAAVLRMPRFNLSRSEAGKLADYFAAVAGAEYPYTQNGKGVGSLCEARGTDRRLVGPFRQKTPDPFPLRCVWCSIAGFTVPNVTRSATVHPPDRTKRFLPRGSTRWAGASAGLPAALADRSEIRPAVHRHALAVSVVGQAAGARHFSRPQPATTRRRSRASVTI